MRANRAMRAYVCTFAVSPDEARTSRSVRTSPQVLTLEARLLRAIRAVHRRRLPDSGAKSRSAWASPSDHSRRRLSGIRFVPFKGL